jgi:hypothetical protein
VWHLTVIVTAHRIVCASRLPARAQFKGPNSWAVLSAKRVRNDRCRHCVRSRGIDWGPEAAWTRLAGALENTGQFNWVVPPGIPPEFRIRLEVLDSVGRRGAAETVPVLVDRAKPRGWTIGLDPDKCANLGQ